ncbi:FctA domain-containing protein [Collinsella sp. CLA-AA-H302]|uniref:Spy0128 family protein n=1 Tax=Collinsella sp. CLA-AA-H302 TaxID=3136217 RepID=UPI0032C05AAE
MKANSDKSKQSNKATRRVLAGVLCGASVLSLILSLVMPPISQAIANDVQTVSAEETVMGGGSSSESTDVDNTNNGDTERQDNNDVKNDEASGDAGAASLLSDDAGVEDAVQPADDSANDEGDIALAVEDADGYTQINTAQDLCNYLQNDKKTGKFRLNADVEYASDITLGAGEVTLDLNGHKIKHNGTESGRNNMSMFNVPAGATFTIEDLNPGVDSECKQDFDKYGNLATLDYDGNGMPSKLTYYVTKSTPNGTATTETLYKHEVSISGAIVGTTKSSTMKLINVYAGGTFNLTSGTLTQAKGCNVGNLIYAENGSTVYMSGGYVCGASMGSSGAGAGIHVEGSTLVISDGVIAGNYAPSGGGVYAMNSTVNMVGGIISGNGTNNDQSGYGAGICAENSNVTITDGYITNNKYQHYDEGHKGNGCHGGGGIAAFSNVQGQRKGSLVISGGYITGNYSAEAGGGVYAGVWNQALSGFTFSGGIIASNVAQNSEGGGIRITAPTESVFNVPIGTKAYITNNKTNTDNDWGGGGVFVQGGGDNNVQPASLKIYNALITKNDAQGFGGGFAACPTGKTAITDTNGIAIFGNTDANGTHRSQGTHAKTDDADTSKGGEITEDFIKAGHQDLFLIRDSANAESLPYIAAVTGQMLGGGAANWSGTIDNTRTSIGKYEGAQAKYMIGLRSDSSGDDQNVAIGRASLYITGNKSNVHGGGIMTNGDVIAGSTTQVSVYPSMKLNGTKALTGRALRPEEFKFQLLKQGASGAPFFDADGKLQRNGCTRVGDGVTNNADGSFAFDLGRVYSDDPVVYYLVEDPGDRPVSGVTYDKTIYKIEFETTVAQTQKVLDITYTYYSVGKVKVTNLAKGDSMEVTPHDGSNVSVNLTNNKTFTNAYTAKGSWTPQVTKKVVGGEMKKFKFELYTKDGSGEKVLDKKWTADDSNSSKTVKFDNQKLEVSDFNDGKATFTYYIRECAASEGDGTKHEGYTNDTKIFKVVVTAADKGDGTLTCTPTYYEVDANNTEQETDNPTFTNTYSTSLPLSGMSGVTLTYLAGAAMLCVAAAWMHIRRKANAKGGERRE